MHFSKLNIKIWAYKFAVNCAEDWFIDDTCCGTIEQVMQEPFRIAAVPVMFNRENDFAYQPGNESIDLSAFDLVLLSDIEYRPRSWIEDWARENNSYFVMFMSLAKRKEAHTFYESLGYSQEISNGFKKYL